MEKIEQSVEMFQRNFVDQNQESSYLYGLGRQTELILEAFPSYPIEGLLDGCQTSGECFGYSVVPLENLLQKKARIIIIARKAAEKIIYRRISSFCRKNGIKVYSLDGRELGMDNRKAQAALLAGREDMQSPYALGHALLGPILFEFSHWLKEKAEQMGMERIFFLARDGYLLEKMFRTIGSDVDTQYLLASRSVCVLATLETEMDIAEAVSMPFSGSAESMLRHRFQLSPEDIAGYEGGKEEIVARFGSRILEKASETRENYSRYLDTFHSTSKKTAIFDFVSSGTCQMCLEKLLGTRLQGLYFEQVRDGVRSKQGLFVSDFLQEKSGQGTEWNYFYFEPLIKQAVPTILNFDKNGHPVYGMEHLDMNQKEFVLEVQRGVMAFAEESGVSRREVSEKMDFAALQFLDDECLGIGQRLVNYDAFTNRVIEWSM